jgi:hypothetical protein
MKVRPNRLSGLLMFAFLTFQCRHKTVNTLRLFEGKPGVPVAIKKEHENILNLLKNFVSLQDSAGGAARKLENLVQHHFAEEEDYVLPPLGLLPLLANGTIPEQSKEIIALTQKLKENMDHLSAEHQMIKAYISELKEVAPKERLPDIIKFENEVSTHAMTEEEIYFPAAMLVGEYLKLKSVE